MTKLQKLQMTIALLDRVSGPLRRLDTGLGGFMQRTEAGFQRMRNGAVGFIGAAMGLRTLINPAEEMNKALGEVRSLRVGEEVLKELGIAGLAYSADFGESAVQYVKSAYDIQSAIAGLSGRELPRFTTASGILAKATKADVTEVTSYMGSMYGIFQRTADKIGRSNWVEQLTGQTATAVQMFKTTGREMAAAFETLGAEGQTMGIGQAEQMAILGRLQATMSGSEAGTKYRALLQGLGKAETGLGLRFSDAEGRALPIIEILTRIRDKYGDIDTLAESGVLMKAFGRKEAVAAIKLLSQNIDALSGDIDKLDKVKGMDNARWMAQQMISPLDRLGASITAFRIGLWQQTMPVIEPFIDKLTEGIKTLTEWTHMFPHLARFVGIALLVVLGISAAIAALTVVAGIGKFTMAGLGLGMGVLNLAGAALMITLRGMALASFGLWAGLVKIIPVVWGFTAALLANPLTWIVLGVVALAGALYFLITRWDKVRAAFAENTWLRMAFLPLALGMDLVEAAIGAFEAIPDWWQGLKARLAALDPFAFLGEKVRGFVRLLNKIPGIDIEMGAAPATGLPATASNVIPMPPAQATSRLLDQDNEGQATEARQRINAAFAGVTGSGRGATQTKGGLYQEWHSSKESKKIEIGQVIIQDPPEGFGPMEFVEELELQAA